MKQYTRISSRASLAAIGYFLRKMGIWDSVKRHVHIQQKVIKHEPIDKLLDGLINLLAGGQGLVEINQRVRPDPALQRAFGRKSCADQSTVSETLNACSPQNVDQMRAALQEIYRQYSRGYRHDYSQHWQLLDVDLTGLTCGRQAEAATKGYFSGKRNRRGRQLGRVLATQYNEIVSEKLYPGSVQLEKSLQELVLGAEQVLELTPEQRLQTIIRIDGGGGTDADIHWLLERDYQFLTKVKNWNRAKKLGQSVTVWYPDPKVPEREMGWVTAPHTYCKPTRQLALRWKEATGHWHYRILVFTLSDPLLFELAGRCIPEKMEPIHLLAAIVDAYDLRGGGVETANKDSKQGLGIHKRNKRRFPAQEMLVYLAELAFNLITWVRLELSRVWSGLTDYGMLRMVRDLFQIVGKVRTDDQGQLLLIRLNRDHPLAKPFQQAFQSWFARNGVQLILGKI